MAEQTPVVAPVTVAPVVAPVVDKVASPASKDADQGTTPKVNLEKTTGSLWAEQQAASAKALEKDPSIVQSKAFDAMHDAATEGSVLYDAEAKKAALLGTSKTVDADAAKQAVKTTAKIQKMQDDALDASREGNILYDAEAKKAALVGGNPEAKVVKK